MGCKTPDGRMPVARIVIEVPDEHKELAAAIVAVAEHVTQVVDRGADGKAVDYARVERNEDGRFIALHRTRAGRFTFHRASGPQGSAGDRDRDAQVMQRTNVSA